MAFSTILAFSLHLLSCLIYLLYFFTHDNIVVGEYLHLVNRRVGIHPKVRWTRRPCRR